MMARSCWSAGSSVFAMTNRREKILPSRSRLTVRFAASARRNMRKPRKPVSRATGKAGHSISTWWSPPLSNWPTPAGSMKVTALDELGSGHLHPPLLRSRIGSAAAHYPVGASQGQAERCVALGECVEHVRKVHELLHDDRSEERRGGKECVRTC